MSKTYTVTKTRGNGNVSTKSGTLDELNAYYGKHAKSIKTLVRQVQSDYADREAAIYNRTTFSYT